MKKTLPLLVFALLSAAASITISSRRDDAIIETRFSAQTIDGGGMARK